MCFQSRLQLVISIIIILCTESSYVTKISLKGTIFSIKNMYPVVSLSITVTSLFSKFVSSTIIETMAQKVTLVTEKARQSKRQKVVSSRFLTVSCMAALWQNLSTWSITIRRRCIEEILSFQDLFLALLYTHTHINTGTVYR